MPKTLSTVDTTKTTTSTSSRAAAAKGPRVLSGPSELEIAAAAWSGMNGQERDSYAALLAQINNSLEPSLPGRKDAYGLFVSLSSANLAAGKPLDTTAQPFVSAPALPDVEVQAFFVGTDFTLILVPNTAYPHPIAVRAAKPMLASERPTTATKFKKIASSPSFSSGINLTASFNSRYRVPGVGYQIALQVMGVAPGGFHTAWVPVTGVVSDAPSAAAQADPQDTDTSQLALG